MTTWKCRICGFEVTNAGALIMQAKSKGVAMCPFCDDETLIEQNPMVAKREYKVHVMQRPFLSLNEWIADAVNEGFRDMIQRDMKHGEVIVSTCFATYGIEGCHTWGVWTIVATEE